MQSTNLFYNQIPKSNEKLCAFISNVVFTVLTTNFFYSLLINNIVY